MQRCPHCGQNGISAWVRLRALVVFPATCRVCGQLSAPSGAVCGIPSVIETLVVLGAILWAYAAQSWLPLAAAAILAILLEFMEAPTTPLRPVSPREVRVARVVACCFVTLFASLLAVAVFLPG